MADPTPTISNEEILRRLKAAEERAAAAENKAKDLEAQAKEKDAKAAYELRKEKDIYNTSSTDPGNGREDKKNYFDAVEKFASEKLGLKGEEFRNYVEAEVGKAKAREQTWKLHTEILNTLESLQTADNDLRAQRGLSPTNNEFMRKEAIDAVIASAGENKTWNWAKSHKESLEAQQTALTNYHHQFNEHLKKGNVPEAERDKYWDAHRKIEGINKEPSETWGNKEAIENAQRALAARTTEGVLNPIKTAMDLDKTNADRAKLENRIAELESLNNLVNAENGVRTKVVNNLTVAGYEGDGLAKETDRVMKAIHDKAISKPSGEREAWLAAHGENIDKETKRLEDLSKYKTAVDGAEAAKNSVFGTHKLYSHVDGSDPAGKADALTQEVANAKKRADEKPATLAPAPLPRERGRELESGATTVTPERPPVVTLEREVVLVGDPKPVSTYSNVPVRKHDYEIGNDKYTATYSELSNGINVTAVAKNGGAEVPTGGIMGTDAKDAITKTMSDPKVTNQLAAAEFFDKATGAVKGVVSDAKTAVDNAVTGVSNTVDKAVRVFAAPKVVLGDLNADGTKSFDFGGNQYKAKYEMTTDNKYKVTALTMMDGTPEGVTIPIENKISTGVINGPSAREGVLKQVLNDTMTDSALDVKGQFAKEVAKKEAAKIAAKAAADKDFRDQITLEPVTAAGERSFEFGGKKYTAKFDIESSTNASGYGLESTKYTLTGLTDSKGLPITISGTTGKLPSDPQGKEDALKTMLATAMTTEAPAKFAAAEKVAKEKEEAAKPQAEFAESVGGKPVIIYKGEHYSVDVSQKSIWPGTSLNDVEQTHKITGLTRLSDNTKVDVNVESVGFSSATSPTDSKEILRKTLTKTMETLPPSKFDEVKAARDAENLKIENTGKFTNALEKKLKAENDLLPEGQQKTSQEIENKVREGLVDLDPKILGDLKLTDQKVAELNKATAESINKRIERDTKTIEAALTDNLTAKNELLPEGKKVDVTKEVAAQLEAKKSDIKDNKLNAIQHILYDLKESTAKAGEEKTRRVNATKTIEAALTANFDAQHDVAKKDIQGKVAAELAKMAEQINDGKSQPNFAEETVKKLNANTQLLKDQNEKITKAAGVLQKADYGKDDGYGVTTKIGDKEVAYTNANGRVLKGDGKLGQEEMFRAFSLRASDGNNWDASYHGDIEKDRKALLDAVTTDGKIDQKKLDRVIKESGVEVNAGLLTTILNNGGTTAAIPSAGYTISSSLVCPPASIPMTVSPAGIAKP